MIVGTAGHIDHGKTSLVKALTGIDTDRLKEEKKRGITIELGFAHLDLGNGVVAGVVDVPGHERFVKAMAAGAGGVDVVVLVVAADEGVMPQTREHLDICRLLGVRKGVIALTKADLLPELGIEWLELITQDLKALCSETFLEDAPIVPCSSKTGEGLDALKKAIAHALTELPERSSEGPAFLPVDRVFTIKGFGTVVTGTLLSGQLALEEQVSLLPGIEGPFRVRGLQIHGHQSPKAQAGSRVAVNVTDVEPEAVKRGMVLTRHQELPTTRMLDVELSLLPSAPSALKKRGKWLLHLGTIQVEATVALIDLEELRPGETAFAQLRLSDDVAALPGQRFILRGSRALEGRGTTVAGGRLLTITPPKRRRGASEVLKPLAEGDGDARVSWLLRQSGYRGLSQKELFARAALPQKTLQRTLELLGARGQAVLVDKEQRRFLHQDVFLGMVARALALIGSFHEQNPMKEGLSREELRQKLSAELDPRTFTRLATALLEGGKVEQAGELFRLKGRGRSLTLNEEGSRAKLSAELSAAGLSPPTVNELAARLSLPPPRVVDLLKVAISEGSAVKVSDELYFSKAALEGLRDRLVQHLKDNREITTQGFKELVGQSRKFVIPLSEYFDREKVTLRV
ncbi:MAG: selenocysteine-specific translation elongation factor, partial [Myxococcaceae bacterium]